LEGSVERAPVVMTGGTSGIGRAAALELARRGLAIVLLVRDPVRGDSTAQELIRAGADPTMVVECDLSLMSSVRRASAELHARCQRIGVLINDASVFLRDRQLTSEGHERMFATNVLGPFLLTQLLLDLLIAAAPSRVINVTAPSTVPPNPVDIDSAGRFAAARVFGQTKAAELMMTYKLARRLLDAGVTVNACHPGITRATGLMRDAPLSMRVFSLLVNLAARSPERAGQGLAALAVSPAFERTTGALLHDGKPIKAPFADDLAAQDRLWSALEKAAATRDGAH